MGTAPGVPQNSLGLAPGSLGGGGGGPGPERGLGFAVLLDITSNYLVISITLSLPPYLFFPTLLRFSEDSILLTSFTHALEDSLAFLRCAF